MNRNIIFFMPLLLTLFLSSCAKQETKTDKAPVTVKTDVVEQSVIGSYQSYPATVEEAYGSSLSFSTIGTVSDITVHEGQKVQKGELIASLDETSLKSAYSAANALLIQASDAYQRMKQLHDNNSLPEIQWIEVQSKLRQAQSAEEIARKNLADSRLHAPFSGVVARKSIDNGQNVIPGQEVVRLVKIDNVKICVPVPENEIAGISIGDKVTISVPALNNRIFDGHIVEKGIAANPITRTYDVKASVGNDNNTLMPGMLCSLFFNKKTESPSIVIPANVIQLDEQNNTIVWLNKGGKAKKRIVTTGILSDKGVQITSGLEAGEEIVTEGFQKISENMSITVSK